MNNCINLIKSAIKINYLSIVVAFLLIFPLCGCHKNQKDELAPQGYRCVFEVWTDCPADIHFWNCSWHGNLMQDGNSIPSHPLVTLMRDIGRFSIENKYYRTEFVTTKQGLLTLNFWILRTEKSGRETFGFNYRARYFLGDKLVKDDKCFDNYVTRLGLSLGCQVYSPYDFSGKQDK